MKKIIIICICIIITFVSITSIVIGTDIEHLQCCHKVDCHICTIINNSINFLKNINYFFIISISIYNIIFIVQRNIKIIFEKKLTTLQKLKVQFNE